ncbi:two-component sensor histidine kinase [Paenibacillus marchantiophytorum]|uniref:histidine kinase n=1 Tax=Paenibacillus marchantiophytorum TaxID=1619310 RepID=A0ABQ2BNS2_9BACL|nr:HAMP domain-containing sensor histidine kinase [Paenibacillus marchantiophytorum]GGI44037.1 two-component sensor histidine kinase [Paenibacillus marchantiophytorum]
MPTQAPKRSSLLRYWTLRYVLTLCIGLFLIGLASIIWLQQRALTDRLQQIESFSVEAAAYITKDANRIVIPAEFYKWIDQNQRKYRLPGQFGLTVYTQAGQVLYEQAAPQGSSSEYKIAAPIHGSHSQIGSIVISYSKKELTDISQEFGLITSLLILAGLMGWLIIYLMLRRLTKPIYEVVHALKQIQTGNYTLMLQENAKEQEIYDLLYYFNATAARLEQLEQLRTELLAGVTHELKTPVTSIRGLLRAIKDQVVSGNEADEFLDISLEETKRLERMVADLLDFNAFASGHVRMQSEALDLGKLLGEIVYQWSLIHTEDDVEVRTDIADGRQMVVGDPVRIQQIIVNLLNNSQQAADGHCLITVRLIEYSSTMYEVLVCDNGTGIPAEEQINIYERYFRGTNKKLAVRGLGLGLTLSRMLAAALGGTLVLKESSPQGTTFQLLLPRGTGVM